MNSPWAYENFIFKRQGITMKFIFFILLVTLNNYGHSDDSSHSDMHKKNQNREQHGSHSDDNAGDKTHDMHKKHSDALLVVEKTMVKTTPPGINNSAAYLTILNNSDAAITLIDVASDAARLVEMHEHIISNGAMKMQRMEPLTIEANSSVKFQPGGYHIMLIGVIEAINAGDKIDITLHFNNGTKKIINSIAKKQYETSENTHEHH
jgi:copper(I)-binding protein